MIKLFRNKRRGQYLNKGSAIFICLGIILLFSCQNPPTHTPPAQTIASKHYFDLKGFIGSEAEKLSAQGGPFIKTVYLYDKKEEKVFETLDLKRELKPFTDSDINKPAWSDKYSIDSVFNTNRQLAGIHYLAQSKKLKTRKMEITYQNAEVSRILILNENNSSVAKTHQQLIYVPASGFSIESRQNVPLMDERLFRIEVRFP